MAKQVVTTTEYTDDLSGGKADRTVAFGFEGQSYEIDLSRSNSRALEKALAPYVGAARKVRVTHTKVARPIKTKRDVSVVREWAKSNGYEVSDRGRVASALIDAYDAAH